MYSPPDMTLWKGRIDLEPEGDVRRWHQCVAPLPPGEAEPGLALFGICCDCGVRRNLGREGARDGPDALRRALAGQAWHLPVCCYDAGNLSCPDDDLEALQEEEAAWVDRLLEAGHFPLLLGGGHEIAFGGYLGLSRYLERHQGASRLGIINFDAHFDLRSAPLPSSGTPFLQMAEHCRLRQAPFRYLCLGISEVANTAALFRKAGELGTKWLRDEELASWNLAAAERVLRDFLAECDALYLSIDLDVLPASVAPGVSAPAARGISLEVVEHLIGVVRGSAGRMLRVADIAEYNPRFDPDGRTAKVAARLCHLLARR
ncbi:MAG TPA: formimidoylglutamase [Geobacter sp.]|nr:formimidoylglutamase [Geobacter sp.]